MQLIQPPIDRDILDTVMARMLDLENILELVVDRLDERVLAPKDFVFQLDQLLLHVFPFEI